MTKQAFKMQLKPGCRDEYKKRHDEIWPELEALLKEHGISDYTIFLDEETDTLFAVQQVSGNSSRHLSEAPVIRKWWTYMSDIMETNTDHSPICTPLSKMFHMD